MSEKIIYPFIAGLISTDGSVFINKKKRSLRYWIYSTEMDWIRKIQKILNEVNIETTVREKDNKLSKKNEIFIYLKNPRKITFNFIKYDCKKYFNPRKWKIIKQGYKFYISYEYKYHIGRGAGGEFISWTKDEDKILRNNLNKTDREIANLLPNRTRKAVEGRRNRLRLTKSKLEGEI